MVFNSARVAAVVLVIVIGVAAPTGAATFGAATTDLDSWRYERMQEVLLRPDLLADAQEILRDDVEPSLDAILRVYDWMTEVDESIPADKRAYLFDPDELIDIVQVGIGLHGNEMFDAVQAELLARYPGHIADTRHWIINDAGGALGEMTLLYATPWEYLIFFGTPIGGGGFSGRYGAHFYDTMIDGVMWTFTEGEVERHVSLPGDQAYLPEHVAKGYWMPDHAWMLECAQGNIIGTFPFGLIAPTRYVTLDYDSAWWTIRDFARLFVKELMQPRQG